MKKAFYTVFTLALLAALAAAFLLFAPKTHPDPYRLRIGGGQGIGTAAPSAGAFNGRFTAVLPDDAAPAAGGMLPLAL